MIFIYKFIPIPVFYNQSFGKGDFAAGKSYGAFIRIKEGYADDVGLLEHEIQHCRQFYSTLGVHAFLYKFSKAYRYKAELECYRIQLGYSKNKELSIMYFVKYLTTSYGLTLSRAEVEYDLKK